MRRVKWYKQYICQVFYEKSPWLLVGHFHFRVKGETPVDWKGFFTFSQQPDYSDLSDVLKIDRREIHEGGHTLDDMIIQCSFDEIECDLEKYVEPPF